MRYPVIMAAWIAFIGLTIPCKGQADKWIGTYMNRETGASLQIRPKADGMYRGLLKYNEIELPIRGISLLGVFSAEYQHQNQWHSFSLTAGQQSYVLLVDGVTIQMERLPPGAKLPHAKPKTPTGASSAPSNKSIQGKENSSWTEKLRGRQLLFLETTGGGTSKAVINLFSNGQYSFESSSSYSSGGFSEFSYADQDKDNGSWKIIDRQGGAILVTVSAKNGQTSEMPIRQGASASQVLINGKRFFVRPLQ